MYKKSNSLLITAKDGNILRTLLRRGGGPNVSIQGVQGYSLPTGGGSSAKRPLTCSKEEYEGKKRFLVPHVCSYNGTGGESDSKNDCNSNDYQYEHQNENHDCSSFTFPPNCSIILAKKLLSN